MLDPTEVLVLSWLEKALHDLATARKAAAGPDPYLDTASYHCQQAAEKAIKGFLTYHSQRFPRTHDIGGLTDLAIPFAPEVRKWRTAADRLTRYATEFRYPGPVVEPSPSEFQLALDDRTAIYQLILSLLPADLRPASRP